MLMVVTLQPKSKVHQPFLDWGIGFKDETAIFHIEQVGGNIN